jgi:hypothetical protein
VWLPAGGETSPDVTSVNGGVSPTFGNLRLATILLATEKMTVAVSDVVELDLCRDTGLRNRL